MTTSLPCRPFTVPAGRQHRSSVLPISLPPRGLSRSQAAAFFGVSPTTFDKVVRACGLRPRVIPPTTCERYDLTELDAAFSALPHAGDAEDDDTDGYAEPPRV